MSFLKEIKFTPTLSIWKSKFDLKNKDKVLKECEEHIETLKQVSTDGYAYYMNDGLKYNGYVDIELKKELDSIMIKGINDCISLHNEKFNEIKMDCWINVVRANNPVQKNYKSNGDLVFHNHVELNIQNKLVPPLYTFVCYIQMPNNLVNDDAVLFIQDVDGEVFSILPEEGDVLIMKGDLPHVPNYASNSTKDRIVLAGSIRMDFSKLNKSII